MRQSHDESVRPRERFRTRLRPLLRDGCTVLDVGAGRRPLFDRSERPAECTYIGSDVDASELDLAGDTYDEVLVDDLTVFNPVLEGRCDLIVSWQVLEHVRPLPTAFDNVRRYLRPGGVFAARLTGRYAPFALLNRMLPRRLGTLAMHRLMGRKPDTVFRAYYDRSYHSALQAMTADWSDVEIESDYLGSAYFAFFPPLAMAHRLYDRWAARHPNLASHYTMYATR